MKLQFMILTGILLATSTSSFAGSKNKCDDLISAGMPQSAIEKCWEKYGKSESYLASIASDRRDYEEDQENEMREAQQIAAEKKRVEILQKSIVEKRFTFLDLKEQGFGLPFVATKRTFKYKRNGQFDKTVDTTLTSGHDMCKLLGFDKAKVVEINSKEIDGHVAKGKALYLKKSSSFLKTASIDEKPYTDTDEDVVVLYMRSVTCVRSKIANNDLLDAIKLMTKSVEADINTGAPIIKKRVAINNKSRNQNEEEEDYNDEDEYDNSVFTHGSGQ